jgi:predicted O-methyltransferase YrrM
MASGSEFAKIFSIEGSQSLLQLSQQNFQKLRFNNITLKEGNFDKILPSLLKEQGKFDLMYIDGNHRKGAILNYFYLSLPYVQNNSMIIFDDIRGSEGMLEAWFEICKNNDVSISLDLYKIGIVFFNKKLKKQHFEVYY